ncbi:MAG: BREX-1 system phosphatase PglZ type A [Planctomycetota bacterium]
MSDLNQINAALERLFNEEGHRIVFWNDPEREFLNTLPYLLLDSVTTIRLDEAGALEVKMRLERDDPTGKYLVYSPAEEPDYEKDWLLDIRLYSRSFRADRASIILQELGLANQSLREHLAARRKFCDNKERLQKLKGLVAAGDTDTDLDRKMIAVVVRAEVAEWFTIVQTIYHAFTENRNGNEINLDEPTAAWDQIEKFDLDKSFWAMAKSLFGYSQDTPTLQNFLIRLLVTDYASHQKGSLSPSLQHLVLPASGSSNAVVCLAQWRDSSSRAASYDLLSDIVGEQVKIDDHLCFQKMEDLLDVMTFPQVEKSVMRSLRDRVASTADTVNAEEVGQIATRRQAKHWANPGVAGSPDVPRHAFHAVYDALVAAADFFSLRNRHQKGFDFDTAEAMYHAYETELFRFDQLYRHFCEAADIVEAKTKDGLKDLRKQIEAAYTNWFITNLAIQWGQRIAPLMGKWQIPEVHNQFNFFAKYMQPRLEEAERRRSFVIISDAFRYEAAEELCRELNGTYRYEAELSSQLGVLPSYTALGMAALLPHKTIAYKPTGEVLVDGKPTTGIDNRDAILAGQDGMAVKAEDLLAKKKEEGREFVSGKRLVYIYHNAVDAVGDKADTEKDTFEAVRKAINELATLVSYIINNLNGHHIVITADHGFLFSETAPSDPERCSLPDKPQGTVIAKKRYLLGHGLPEQESVWHGKTDITASAEGGMEFWIPRGANRFHFVGGARFIHGGAMLQEIVVPVVTVRHIKGKSVADTKTKQVAVQVLGINHRITTSQHRFELIQMEPVSDRVKPITLKLAIFDGDEPVTSIESVTFDSVSGNLDERKKWVFLTLQDRQYDKKTPYRLVLRDADTGIEQQSVPVIIDRAFSDDF